MWGPKFPIWQHKSGTVEKQCLIVKAYVETNRTLQKTIEKWYTLCLQTTCFMLESRVLFRGWLPIKATELNLHWYFNLYQGGDTFMPFLRARFKRKKKKIKLKFVFALAISSPTPGNEWREVEENLIVANANNQITKKKKKAVDQLQSFLSDFSFPAPFFFTTSPPPRKKSSSC